jgi:hypothetical protein
MRIRPASSSARPCGSPRSLARPGGRSRQSRPARRPAGPTASLRRRPGPRRAVNRDGQGWFAADGHADLTAKLKFPNLPSHHRALPSTNNYSNVIRSVAQSGPRPQRHHQADQIANCGSNLQPPGKVAEGRCLRPPRGRLARQGSASATGGLRWPWRAGWSTRWATAYSKTYEPSCTQQRPAANRMSGQGTVVEDAPAVASSGRRPHPDLLRQTPLPGSTVAARPCGFGLAVPACLVGWSEPGTRPRAVSRVERPGDAPARGDRHPARIGVRQGPQMQLLAQARRPPSVHPADLRLALPGVPHPRPAVLQPRRPAVPGARHRAAGRRAGPAVAGQGDDEGRHSPRRARR